MSAIRVSSRSGLLVRASGVALSAALLTPSVYAQTTPTAPAAQTDTQTDTAASTDATNPDDIIVTGLRASIQTARDQKKNADTIVDSVSAQDIGALPDRSVTEALQRIPGVSITRFASGNNPDRFSVEGSGVVIRGLTYSRSQLNGRDTFTANNGRGLSFADVPSELLSGVDVFKSPSADMIEGGISGIVNLRTRVPFDSRGRLLAATVDQNYSDLANRSSPNVSVLASDRFTTGIGEFGFLANFVRSELYSRADGIQIANFALRGLTSTGNLVAPNAANAVRQVYQPRGGGQRTQEYNRIRYGYAAAAQWRSLDGRATATFQFLRSDAREKSDEHVLEISTEAVISGGDAQVVPGSALTFDDDGIFTGGFLTANLGYRDDQFNNQARTPLTGLRSNNTARVVDRRLITDDYGANLKWEPTDRLALTLDYQHVKSTVDIFDFSGRNVTYQNADIRLTGNEPASIVFSPVPTCAARAQCPSIAANAFPPRYFLSPNDSFLSPFNSFYGAAMDHVENSEGNEDAAKIDLRYSVPDSWLRSIDIGYRYADRKNIARFSTYNFGQVSDTFAGGGPVWLDDRINGIPDNIGSNPARLGGEFGPQEAYFFPNFYRGDIPNPAGPGRLYVPTEFLRDYATSSKTYLQIGDEWRTRLVNGCPQNWVPLAQRCGVIPGTDYLPGEINPVQETVNAGYGVARFGGTLGNGWKLSGNAGVRYTKTRRVASGFFSFPRRVYTCPPPPAAVSPLCSLGPAVVADANAFANGALTPTETDLSYDYFLPSFNARLELGGGLQFRAAFSKALAAPDFGLTRAFYNVTLNVGDQAFISNGRPLAVFNVGNPDLKPTRADNFDLTAEYYFNKVGQLSVAMFAKDLRGVVTNGTARQTFNNNGVTFDGIVTTPLNSEDVGRVRGVEFGYSQTYDFLPGLLSGLGLTANFTYVKAKGVRQGTLSSVDPDVGAGTIASVDTSRLPLQGLSKYTVNFQPFYQLGKLELRAAYAWRSRFLLTTRDVIIPFAPIYSESTGQLDGSIFVNVTPNIRLGAQGYNLSGTTTRTRQVINNDLLTAPRSWFRADRRYTLSLRARLGQ